ncbi:MAG: helix-turn-helix transcriptional regulator [Clostridiales bacterium]|nr:helix-turn-helix transcriptional regulator [Clostridiales bacterium]
MMNIGNIVGKRIKELLYEKDISVYRLSRITCLTEKTINDLIKGESKDVKLSTIYAIIKALNISINEFFLKDYFANDNVDI